MIKMGFIPLTLILNTINKYIVLIIDNKIKIFFILISIINNGINFCTVRRRDSSFIPIESIKENNQPWKGGIASLNIKAGFNIS